MTPELTAGSRLSEWEYRVAVGEFKPHRECAAAIRQAGAF
jgi:hypothetical protein